MSRTSTRAEGRLRINRELERLGYAVAPYAAEDRPGLEYFLLERQRSTYLCRYKTCSHRSGLVFTGNDDDEITAHHVATARQIGAEPVVIACSIATGEMGEQEVHEYRRSVVAGEREYLTGDARRTKCALAHGPAYMDAIK